jgi:hypothetical protein
MSRLYRSRVNSWFDGFCNKVPKYASNVSSHILFTGDYFNNFIDSDISCLWALIFPLSEIIRPCFPHASRKNHTVMMFNSTKHSNTNNFSTSLQLPGIRKTNDWREYTVCASHIKNYIPFRGICNKYS